MDLSKDKLITIDQFESLYKRPFIKKPTDDMLVGHVCFRICNETGIRAEMADTIETTTPDAPILTANPNFIQMVKFISTIFDGRKEKAEKEAAFLNLHKLLRHVSPAVVKDTLPTEEDATKAKDIDPRLTKNFDWVLCYLASKTLT